MAGVQRMKVLIIAPTQADLAFQFEEVQRLANVFQDKKLLLGNVKCSEVTDAITEYRPDIIWFSTHGGPDGIVLSDCWIDGDMLASAIRGTNTSLIVLNTCESRQIAERIYAATNCHIVATIGAVDDRHAFVTAQRFAVLLSTGLKPYEAFQKAKSYQFTYIPDMANGAHSNGNGYDTLRIVAEQQMEIDRLSRFIQSLQSDMAQLMLKFQTMQEAQRRQFQSMQTSQWVLAALVIVLLVLQLSQVLQ